jgi:hypothetical protein
MTLSELLDELWVLWFTILRSAVLAFALIAAFVTEKAARTTGTILAGVRDWHPARPEIFEWRASHTNDA